MEEKAARPRLSNLQIKIMDFTKKIIIMRIQDMENYFLSQLQDLENATKSLQDLLKGDLFKALFSKSDYCSAN